jgi:RimJ/RimL family protein N-acetyltransferase
VGTAPLVMFPLPSGCASASRTWWFAAAARGRGVGAALTEAALRPAREAGAAAVDLTSRPSRQAANRLYERAGFAPRDTTVYRYTLDQDTPAPAPAHDR